MAFDLIVWVELEETKRTKETTYDPAITNQVEVEAVTNLKRRVVEQTRIIGDVAAYEWMMMWIGCMLS